MPLLESHGERPLSCHPKSLDLVPNRESTSPGTTPEHSRSYRTNPTHSFSSYLQDVSYYH